MSESSQLDRLQQWAMHYHSALITPGEADGVRFVEAAKSQQLSRQLERRVHSALSSFAEVLDSLEHELSEFLRKDSAHLIRKDVQSTLCHRAASLHLHEVQTEVLASWLAETSDSSSVADGEGLEECP